MSSNQPLKYYPIKVLIVLVLIILFSKIFILSLFDQELHLTGKFLGASAGAIAIIAGTIAVFNKYCLSYKCVQKLMGLPNLNGRYEGEITSSYKDDENKHITKKCVLEISQDLTGFKVFGYFGDAQTGLQTSSSISHLNNIEKNEDGSFTLIYLHSNDPEPLQNKFIYDKHTGTTVLKYNPFTNELNGYYYNYERASHGEIKTTHTSNYLYYKL
jgi:hypothetical protein